MTKQPFYLTENEAHKTQDLHPQPIGQTDILEVIEFIANLDDAAKELLWFLLGVIGAIQVLRLAWNQLRKTDDS